MLLFKIIFLQLFWFFIVLYGKMMSSSLQVALAFLVIWADFFFYKPNISLGRYIFLTIFFLVAGLVNDYSLVFLELIDGDSYHYGNLSLWIIFIAYYDQIFSKLKKIPFIFQALLGGFGGSSSYWSAAKLGAIVITPDQEMLFVASQALAWAVFFPLSLKLYNNEKFWNNLLDRTIVFSFDRTGYLRHEKMFDENLSLKNFSEKNILVTGATGGIGSAAGNLLSKVGAKVTVTGRNPKKGADFLSKNKNSKFVSLDMANWIDVQEFAKNAEVYDHLVLNAGSMPETYSTNVNGVEFQCASQLLGHYFLLVWLKKFGKIKPGARVVWVSSGGMYLKKLDLDTLFQNAKYDKVETYANVKRAQVTLVEELAKKAEWKDIHIYSMHPGWVGTDGLKEALPKFYSLMKNRLRTPEEGADTIAWCLLADKTPVSGGFYFDRKKVSPYISKQFSPTLSQRAELIKKAEEYIQLVPAHFS